MTTNWAQFRIATYNTHKCRGLDGRIVPERIIAVIQELDADILCLQEIVNSVDGRPIWDQAGQIARALPEYNWAFGANRPLHGGTYGNMTLTRLPIVSWKNHDLPKHRREERGVLQTEIALGDAALLHLFNVHLGTGYVERRFQGRKLVSPDILSQPELTGPRLVIGDFNEWTHGLTTKLMRKDFHSIRPQHAWRYPRTYPGVLPILTLDHLYFEPPLHVGRTRLWRTRRALVASDHLPLVANFQVGEMAAQRLRAG